MTAEPEDLITVLLDRIRQGSVEAKTDLVARLYQRFLQQAHLRLGRERPGHSLATTDLTNEALLCLIKNDEFARAADRNQLFRAFARALRQVLIDHARKRNALVHGGGRQREELDDLAEHIGSMTRLKLLDLHEALSALAAEHRRAAVVLEMRFFGGYAMAEIALILSSESEPISLRTVERDSRLGLAWLGDYLSAGDGP